MLRPRILVLLLGFLLISALAPTTTQRYPEIYSGDFDQAIAYAKERNAIMVIGVIQEGEDTNEIFKTDVWQRGDFKVANEDTITMLVNDGKHRLTKITEELPNGDTIEREVCSHFHTDTCGVHKRLWNVAYNRFNSDGDMRTPQLIVLMPDGTEHGRLIDEGSLSTNIAMINDAKLKAGPSISAKALGIVKEQTKLATQHAGASRHGAAWHAWQKVLAETQHGQYAEAATKGTESALAGYQTVLTDAQTRLEQGEIIDGWQRLVALGAEWVGSPLEKNHAKLVKRVEKDKRYKDAIEAHKHELEAEALWKEIEALINANEERKALKAAKKLVRKYGDTKAAERARREFPELEG